MLKFVFANLALFVVYCAIALLSDWVSVKGVLHWNSFVLEWGVPAVMLSAIPVTCFVNWWLLSIEKPRKRLFVGIALGLLAIAIAIVPYGILVITFHLAIGGTL